MKIRFFTAKKIPSPFLLEKFAKAVCLSVKGLRSQGEISIVFLSDSNIKKINKTFLKHDTPTDVIAFRYPYNFFRAFKREKSSFPFGDIYISVDTALKQAKSGAHLLKQELALLVAHGLLHLAGYEDSTPKLREKMFYRQKILFKKIAPKLAPPDFRMSAC